MQAGEVVVLIILRAQEAPVVMVVVETQVHIREQETD
jgi:hypothetical protein